LSSDGENEVTVILTDGKPISGELLTDIDGHTPYGLVTVHARAILSAVTANDRVEPLVTGGPPGLEARLRRVDGTMRRLTAPVWVRVPEPHAADLACTETKETQLVGPGWIDCVDIAETVDIEWVDDTGGGGRPCRVRTRSNQVLDGRLDLAPAGDLEAAIGLRGKYAAWLLGTDGTTVVAIAEAAISSIAFSGHGEPGPTQHEAEIEIVGAEPPVRHVHDARPVLYGSELRPFLKHLALVDRCLLISSPSGSSVACVPLPYVRKIEPEGSDTVSVLVVQPGNSKPVHWAGRLLTGMEGATRYGFVQVAADHVGRFTPAVGAPDKVTWSIDKLRSGGSFRVEFSRGESVVLDDVFLVAEVTQDGRRRIAPMQDLVIRDRGIPFTYRLKSCRSVRLFPAPALGPLARTATVETIDAAGLAARREGFLQVLRRLDDSCDYDHPEASDLVCGWKDGILVCIPLHSVHGFQAPGGTTQGTPLDTLTTAPYRP